MDASIVQNPNAGVVTHVWDAHMGRFTYRCRTMPLYLIGKVKHGDIVHVQSRKYMVVPNQQTGELYLRSELPL